MSTEKITESLDLIAQGREGCPLLQASGFVTEQLLDCTCTINVAVAAGNEAIQESVFTGTHTDTFHVPNSQDIPPTGKSVAIPYTLGLTYLGGKWSSFRLIFDRAELLTQLGLMPT